MSSPGRACNRYLGTSMHVRKYDMIMLVRHAKDGDEQTRHWRYQRRPCAVRGGLIYPRWHSYRCDLDRALYNAAFCVITLPIKNATSRRSRRPYLAGGMTKATSTGRWWQPNPPLPSLHRPSGPAQTAITLTIGSLSHPWELVTTSDRVMIVDV